MQIEQHPILGKITSLKQHEGTTVDFERVEMGRKTQNATISQISIEIKADEVPTLVGIALETKLRSMAEQAGAHKVRKMFERIAEATEETGNKLDAGGKPISAEMLINMIDLAQGNFDTTGKSTASFVIHPESLPAMKRASEEVEQNPVLKARLDAINIRKLREWNARENSRKLVD